jgi:hypothetical protein
MARKNAAAAGGHGVPPDWFGIISYWPVLAEARTGGYTYKI